ncbi:MAG TPA: antibiotic biosynthesis monooxygenase [Actinomycetota bacterium]|nr:antibiotic biosynthesis monooxygenase [Actinomycetota bacterium]
MVLVQFRVTVPDVAKFKAAYEKWRDAFEQDGAGDQRLYRSESDPNEVTMMSEWASHDEMHAASEKYGPDFNKEAGTEGLEWETRIWHELG